LTTARLLAVSKLGISACLADGERTIVSDVELTVSEHETIAIVGESGSGKSMTAKALTGLLPERVVSSGNVMYRGQNLLKLKERQLQRIRGTEVGLVMQDPFTMLNPLMRCGQHITELLRRSDGKRLSRREERDEAIRRLAEVGINDPDVANSYPFQLSGGMRQRVGIAAALALDPRLLIADEPSTALDVTTQREILALLKRIQRARGMAMILITHDLRLAFSLCDRIYVMYAGSVVEVGPGSDVESQPLHPYTLGLLLSEPAVDRRLPELNAIGGSVPRPDDVASICPFADRCPWAASVCRSERPPLLRVRPDRHSACVRLDEIEPELRLARADAPPTQESVRAPVSDGQLLFVQGVSKVFGTSGRGRVVRALSDVTLEMARGEAVGLVGESGSGKTTLGRCIVGLEQTSSGRVLVDGVDVTELSKLSGDARRRYRRTVQIVFQDPYSSLNPVRTVGATLSEAVALVGGNRASRDVAQLLELVGLPAGYARRKPVSLSGGERQRVAIARALAVEPQLLVCDEAVSALDVSVQAQILNLLRRLQDELDLAILFITHDLAVVRQIADRIYVLYRGEIVESGASDVLLDAPSHPYTRELISSIPRGSSSWLEEASI
jgi:peptide/nickel transport system ATP-binding protein